MKLTGESERFDIKVMIVIKVCGMHVIRKRFTTRSGIKREQEYEPQNRMD